jgi:hypothetical protein
VGRHANVTSHSVSTPVRRARASSPVPARSQPMPGSASQAAAEPPRPSGSITGSHHTGVFAAGTPRCLVHRTVQRSSRQTARRRPDRCPDNSGTCPRLQQPSWPFASSFPPCRTHRRGEAEKAALRPAPPTVLAACVPPLRGRRWPARRLPHIKAAGRPEWPLR